MTGSEFEKYVGGLFDAAGCEVEYTKVSHDKGVDLLVIYNERLFAIQCKCYRKPVGVKAVQEAYSGAEIYHAWRACVVSRSGFTPDAVTMAKSLGVLLIDIRHEQDISLDAEGRLLALEPCYERAFNDIITCTHCDIMKRYQVTKRQIVKYLLPQGLPLTYDGQKCVGLWQDVLDWEAEKQYAFIGDLLERKIVFNQLPPLD